MKKILTLLTLCAAVMSSCVDGNLGGDAGQAIVASDPVALSQTLESDATAGNAVSFVASRAWTSAVTQVRTNGAKMWNGQRSLPTTATRRGSMKWR